MKVIIAEKPSLARNIVSSIDEKMKKADGYYYNDDYIVTFAFGHLFRLYDIEMYQSDYDPTIKYKWTMEGLPFYPPEFKFGLQHEEGIIKQFKIIRDLINREEVSCIVNAGDSDREGEIIVRLIIRYALKSDKPIKRLWMPDQTPKTIKQELETMREDSEYDALANEGLARTYVDWLYGINLSRFASIKASSPFRVGRVIVPIVQAIYDRDMAIAQFQPRKYFILNSKEKTNGEIVELTCKQEFEENELEKAKQVATSYNALKVIVSNVSSEKKVIPPGKLYSLSKLQGEMGKKYKMSLDKTLSIVQSLYEKGYVTYPRTPSQYLAENEKNKFKEILANFASLNVPVKFKDTKSIFDDSKIESHSALTPTYKIPRKTDLSEEENKVYQAIAHRFFAVFAKEDCVVSRSTIEMVLQETKETFKLTGDIVLSKGWTSFEEREKKDKVLPNVKIGDVISFHFTPIAKESTPPKRYTTETLNNFLKNPFKDNLKEIDDNETEKEDLEEIKAMFEGVELGTEATRSSIIENAIKSKYISLKDNVYKLEPIGKYYIETLNKLHIVLPKEKTAEVGKALKKVFRNEYKIEDSISMVKQEIDGVFAFKLDEVEIGRAPKVFEVEKENQLCKCPRCGNFIAISDVGYRCCNSGCGLSLYKDNKLFASLNKKLTKTIAKQIFTKGEVEFTGLVSTKTGKTYDTTLVADFSNKYVGFKFTFPKKEGEPTTNS